MTPDRPSSPPLLAGLDPTLRDKYLAGTCTPQELRQIDAWVSGHPARRAALMGLRRGLTMPIEYPEFADASEIAARVHATTTPAARRVAKSSKTSVPFMSVLRTREGFGGRVLLGIAGALALVIGGWMFLVPRPRTAVLAYATYTTKVGQVAHLTLADGSRVTLGPNTTLRVERSFERSRDLVLTGEAFFDVASADHTPFIVHTGNVITRVLGTRFDVRHYVTDTATRVVVVTGKVAVGSPRQSSVTLVAGAMGQVTDSTSVVMPVNDMAAATGWTAGRLRFREAPVIEVLAQLSRWYGIELRLTDSTLNHEIVTTDIDFDATSDAVRALEGLLNVTASSGGTHAGTPVVVLRPRRSASRAPVQLRQNPRELTTMEVGR